jgi:hypothetical protein
LSFWCYGASETSHASSLDEFFGWSDDAPRSGFTKPAVNSWRISLEARGLEKKGIRGGDGLCPHQSDAAQRARRHYQRIAYATEQSWPFFWAADSADQKDKRIFRAVNRNDENAGWVKCVPREADRRDPQPMSHCIGRRGARPDRRARARRPLGIRKEPSILDYSDPDHKRKEHEHGKRSDN